MKKYIVPSLITNSQKELIKMVNQVSGFVEVIQVDVMDGQFVPNKSFGFNFKLPEVFSEVQAHIMVEDPDKWVRENYHKCNMIIFHLKASLEVEKTIKLIKSKGLKVGIAINPEVLVSEVEPFIDLIDLVLVMTVNPGGYGAEFLPRTLNKVKALRNLRPSLNIEVDGSVNDQTIKKMSQAGANYFVSGSFIMKAADPIKAIERLRSLI